jgi:hypothetical protein
MIPRLNSPLRYIKGKATVNNQGSLDDIAARVFNTCVTEPGSLEDSPEFGLPDQTFSEQPINSAKIAQIIQKWVPDSTELVEAKPEQFDEAVVNAGIQVKVRT